MVTLDTCYTIQRYIGLSTDAKPTENVPNGSRFIEMDTSVVYCYDESASNWIAQTGAVVM